MSRVQTRDKTGSLIANPAAWVNGTYYNITGQTTPIGQGSDGTSYAQVGLTRGSGATTEAIWSFDCSSIPEGATITSISCSCKCSINNTRSNRITTRQAQLYSGTTAKGSAYTVENSTTAFNITCGTWTRAELQNARIRLYAVRGTSNTTSNYYFRFYGATLTVNYSYQEQYTEYEITTTVQSGSTTFSPTSQYVESGLDGVVTINNLSDISTFSLTDNGDNVTSELTHISGNTYTYTIENISSDHTLIAKTVPAYNVTVTDNTDSNLTYLNPTGVTRVGQGSDFEVRFLPTNIDYINIYDNNVIVNKSTLIAPSTVQDFTTLNPSQYIQGGSGTISNTNNGLTDVSSTTYAQCGGQSGQYLIYGFDTTTIPSNATIISVECSAKVEHTHGNTTYGSVQLYYGTTAKGSASTFRTTSVVNLNCGTWTREELQNIRIRIGNNYSGGTTSYYTRFYGANLTITYEYENNIYYIYTATNVQAARTIRFEDKVKYNITSSSELSGISFNPSSTQVYEGNDVTIEIVGVTSPNAFKLLDNNENVTSSVVAPISNTYEVTTQVSGAGYGFSLNGNGYYESTNQGENESIALARINFEFDSASEITIQYINYAEATYDYGIFGYLDTALSTSVEADSNAFKRCNNSDDNSPDPQTIVYQIPAGSHFIDIKYYKDTYTGENNDSLQWKILDNQPSGSNNYTYTITNVVGNHTLRIEENTYYSVSGTSSFSGKTISGTSNKVYEGDSITLTLTGITNPYSFTLKDNGIDVTSTIVGELSNAYQITEKVSAATYGFELNDNGYYESTNQGIDESASVCRINFNCSIPYEVTIQYINYGESRYDYGIFGNIDSALGTTYTADSNTFKSCNTSEDNTLTAQTLVYTIPVGSHFIDIKYRKDSGTNNSPDSLQWKILDIGPASGVTYTYTINNVSSNHTLVLSEKTKYTITASSSYSGVTTSVSNPNPYGGESSTITINNVSDISLISIFDNGVTAITGRFSQSGTTLTYTFENISTNHSISVVEHIYYSLSITNDTESSTVTPTGTISNIDAGESYTITLETSDISIIQVIDNDINKTEDLVHITEENGSEELLANSYSNGDTGNNFTVSNAARIYRNSSNTANYATLTLTNTANAVSSMFLEIDTSFLDDVPSFVDSFTVTGHLRERAYTTSYVSAFSKQFYSGNTAKGTAETTRSNTTGVRTINGGTWTRSELENLRLYLTATHNDSTNSASIRFFGFDVTITYTVPEHYEYTLSDISSNHTIVFMEGAAFTMYSKDNNAWVQVSKVYKKINGNWVEIMNPNSLFESNKIYIRK